MSDERDFPALAERALQRAVDWRSREPAPPTRPQASVEELRAGLAVTLPLTGRDGREILDALADAAEPGLVGNIRSDFYGWVMGASHPVGVAAEWLATAWGQNAAIYETSPAAAVAEEVAADWLLDLLDLPRASSMAFTTGATTAGTICVAAARSEVLRRAGHDMEADGLFGAPRVRVFLGAEAHASVHTGLRYLGFGESDLVRIEADRQGRMQAADLAQALSGHAGPGIVICQAGHINSGAFDPLPEITDIASSQGAWCHVDGAFGLWARTAPTLSSLCAGAEHADSWAVDGHKWLQVPYDSAFAVVRDAAAHQRVMDTTASYLEAAPGDGRCPSHFSPALSRRARGFAVWAVLQALGRQGIEEMVLRHCRCARELGERLAREPGIAVLNDVVLNQVAVAFGDGNDPAQDERRVQAVIAGVSRRCGAYLAAARWRCRRVLRISVISRATDAADIHVLGDAIIDSWRELRRG